MAAENKTGNDSNPNSRKRKSVAKGKCRDIPCSSPAKVIKNKNCGFFFLDKFVVFLLELKAEHDFSCVELLGGGKL